MPEADFSGPQPPPVRIAKPESGIVETDRVLLEVTVTDQGGGAAAVQLFQNGARVLAESQRREEGKTAHYTFQVALVEGENRFRVTSATADGSWESEPAEIVLRYQKPLARTALHLIAVGVNKYQQETLNLKFAAADAQAIADLFERRGPRSTARDRCT
jgi:hypothetical protein